VVAVAEAPRVGRMGLGKGVAEAPRACEIAGIPYLVCDGFTRMDRRGFRGALS
jgi:hypothetical protein